MKKTGSGTPVGFLLDMDGVIYRGSELIPGALEFIRALQDQGIPFMFLTNNSQRTRLDIAMKLQRLGFNVEERHVYTCAIATAEFLASQKPNGTAFVIGEGGLLNALHEKGWAVTDQDPDYVVVGEGRTFTFEVIEQAVNLILGGGPPGGHQPGPELSHRPWSPSRMRRDRGHAGTRDRGSALQRG